MRRLFVHVGTHKTGTTSFQAWLLDNRARLRALGVAVMTETSRRHGVVTNCFTLANAALRPGLMTEARMTGAARPAGPWRFARARASALRFLSEAGAERFVISAEAFCFARTETELSRVRRLFAAPDLEVIPVVCLRDASAWRESWRAYLERPAARRRLPHGSGADDIRGDWYFDADRILAFWGNLGAVRSIDYDAATARDGSILPALLAAMELGPDAATKPYFLNSSRDRRREVAGGA